MSIEQRRPLNHEVSWETTVSPIEQDNQQLHGAVHYIQPPSRCSSEVPKSPTSWSRESPSKCEKSQNGSYGKPLAKPRVEWTDVLAVTSSFAALAVALLAILNDHIAWTLNYNFQIQVVGVLISIMSICLAALASRIFLLVEVRFGRSTLSNFEGILRGQAMQGRLDWFWRVAILVMLVIGPGLDIVPKSGFLKGGSSSIELSKKDVLKTLNPGWPTVCAMNASYGTGKYGMFGPAGLHSLGGNTGLSLFTNATLTYLNDSNTITWFSYGISLLDVPAVLSIMGEMTEPFTEPPLPAWPLTYGFNMLVVDNDTTAMLDAPNPDYLTAVRSSLAIGDSWNITADVQGTLATRAGLAADDPTFPDFCNNATTWRQELDGTDGSIILAESTSGSGIVYFGYTEDSVARSGAVRCKDMAAMGAWRYTLTRQPCKGTWTVTRGGSQLMNGTCAPSPAIWDTGDVFHLSGQSYTKFYPVQLEESLAPYATTRKSSVWRNASTNTMMAAMAWSRLTSLYSAADSRLKNNTGQGGGSQQDSAIVKALQLGTLYDTDDHVVSTRPALERSWILFLALCVQPVLALLIFIGILVLHETPISKGFGLTSILAGIHPESLALIEGASLSGELSEDVYMSIRPVGDSVEDAQIEYMLRTKDERTCSGTLMRSMTYS